MDFIIYFLIAAIISFLGSLQPGPVNMAVLYAASNKQYKQGLYIAIGGSIPEFIFSFIALKFYTIISIHVQSIHQFSLALDILFIAIGILLFFVKKSNKVLTDSSLKKGFFTGFLLAIVNPQLILFWLAVITSLSIQQIQIDTNGQQIAFAIGTIIGAFLLHLLLLYAIKQNANNSLVIWLETRSTQIIGVVLILVGSFHFIVNYSI